MGFGGYTPKAFTIMEATLRDFSRPPLGLKAVAVCANSDLVSWIADHKGWSSPHTKTHRMGLVVSCFRWASKERLIERCPFERDSKLWPAAMPREAINPEEYAAVMRCARPRHKWDRPRTRSAFRRALAFLWETGARTCEMKEIAWEQIDLGTATAILTVGKTTRSTGQKRIIILSDKIVRLLTWIKRHECPGPGDLVFLNGRKTPWTNGTFGRLFRKLAKMAGVRARITAYSLRHGFCVRALEMGIGERQIADLMGHSSTKHIAWYGRSARSKVDYLKATLDAMNRRPEI
jgi:integrase